MVKFRKNSYSDLTNILYQELAWGPFFKKQDRKYIKNMDNASSIYIKESLKIVKSFYLLSLKISYNENW